jgi:teichuronic acid biosynthesis glycosyltransferase TuaC
VPQARLSMILGAADGLVLCSDREGIANVIMEALACGTPVVATPVCGTPEILSQPEAGVLMRNRSPEAMADAVRMLLNAPPDRSKTRAHAERYTWQATAAQHLGLLDEAIADYRLSSSHGYPAPQHAATGEQ